MNLPKGSAIADSLSRRGSVASFIAMDMMRRANQRAQQGLPVFHLEVGQPSTAAPACVLQAAQQALAGDKLGYTDALGLDGLRADLADFYRRIYGLEIDPARFVVTTGSSAGFVLAFLATLDAGQKVALAAPGYPAYANIIKALDLQPVWIETGPETDWQITASAVQQAAAQHNGIDALLLASPANPTGTMITKENFAALATLCASEDWWLISDEIYHGLTESRQADCALGFAHNEKTIIINSFSKYFSMTGWRIGWMIIPDAMIRTVERLQQNLFISAPTLSQHAARAALSTAAEGELLAHLERYRGNREVLLAGLNSAGLTGTAPPDGAFYLYTDLRRLTGNGDAQMDSSVFCRQLLDESGVTVTPGVDFDTRRGHHFVRLSYAGKRAEIEQATDHLTAFIAAKHQRKS